jgi:hypothetical protein
MNKDKSGGNQGILHASDFHLGPSQGFFTKGGTYIHGSDPYITPVTGSMATAQRMHEEQMKELDAHQRRMVELTKQQEEEDLILLIL